MGVRALPITPRLGAEDRARSLRQFDWWLLLAAAVLVMVGLLSLYSIQHARPEAHYFSKQLLRVAVGVVPFALFLRVPARSWQRGSWFLYAANVALLLAVLVIGRSGGGALRWIALGPLDFQPSEMAKLFVTLTLATFLANRADRIKESITQAHDGFHAPAFVMHVIRTKALNPDSSETLWRA